MRRNAPREHIDQVISEIEQFEGLQPVPLFGVERTVIAVIGEERVLDEHHIRSLPSVADVMSVLQPFKLASRETKHENTIVTVKNVSIGGKTVVMMWLMAVAVQSGCQAVLMAPTELLAEQHARVAKEL
ncbi:MAG: hypothetical protein AAB592_01740, partial [Patescibacteria group bacterium]